MSLASPIEVGRSTHEESERYSLALASLLNTHSLSSSSSSSCSATNPPTRTSLTNAHIASILTDRIVQRNRNLVDFYTDETGIRREEMDLLQRGAATATQTQDDEAGEGQNGSTQNGSSSTGDSGVMDLFYSRLNHIKQYHEKHPAAPPDSAAFSLDIPALEHLIAPSQSGVSAVAVSAMDRLFSGEEGVGRYLDLYEQHSQYINLKGVKRVNYLGYLDRFHEMLTSGDLAAGPSAYETKRSEAYAKYLAGLRGYLVHYLRKIRPLDDIDALVAGIENDCSDRWEQGQLSGWEDQGEAFAQPRSGKAPAPAAKPEGDANGIWCEACQKSFAKQTVYDAHLTGNKHKKAVERASSGGGAGAGAVTGTGAAEASTPGAGASGPSQSQKNKSEAQRVLLLQKARSLAKDEHVVRCLAEGNLAAHRADTRTNVERRGALTERERAAEAEELARASEGTGAGEGSSRAPGAGAARRGDASDSEDSDADDSKIYNPKKLPLGWDGRPIPVWLYKLHGLGVEFRCEICSDHVYQGRKNFDRHFSESRHAFGMRALGLPNTRHFQGITRIEDALALAEKLKKVGKAGGAGAGAGALADGGGREVEEVEDESGNTYTRKDYELLKRQGLI